MDDSRTADLLTSTAKPKKQTRLTLEILGSIERLLFLQQECIADQWQSADRLAVCPVTISDTFYNPEIVCNGKK